MPPEYDSEYGFEYDSEAVYADGGAPERLIMAKVRQSRTKRQKRPDKGVAGDLIITKMTGNTHYTEAADVLGAFTTANTNLKAAHAALEAARQLVEEKLALAEAADAAWDLAFSGLALHVEQFSQGDLAMLESTGFEIQNLPSPVGELAAPDKLVVSTNGHEGVMKLRWPKVRGVKTWVVERTITVNDGASWEQVALTAQASFEDAGLTPGTKYWYRVAAIGTVGRGPWSDAICKMAI